jgi:hypothetical protein
VPLVTLLKVEWLCSVQQKFMCNLCSKICTGTCLFSSTSVFSCQLPCHSVQYFFICHRIIGRWEAAVIQRLLYQQNTINEKLWQDYDINGFPEQRNGGGDISLIWLVLFQGQWLGLTIHIFSNTVQHDKCDIKNCRYVTTCLLVNCLTLKKKVVRFVETS